MGPSAVHTEAAQEGHAAYRVIRYLAVGLPPQYRNLILSKWKRSLRYGNDYFKLSEPESFYSAYDLYISRLMGLPQTVVRLAVLAEDSDVVLGFSVSRGAVLDYVHVHQYVRRRGIGRSLVPHDIQEITHLTKTGLAIWGNKFPEWTFNPFA